MAMSRTRTHIVINPIACTGRQLCAELLPELIGLDDWGYPIVQLGPVPTHLEAHARRAASACPTLALLLRREPDREAPPDALRSARR
jgi:ferredoxin